MKKSTANRLHKLAFYREPIEDPEGNKHLLIGNGHWLIAIPDHEWPSELARTKAARPHNMPNAEWTADGPMPDWRKVLPAELFAETNAGNLGPVRWNGNAIRTLAGNDFPTRPMVATDGTEYLFNADHLDLFEDTGAYPTEQTEPDNKAAVPLERHGQLVGVVMPCRID